MAGNRCRKEDSSDGFGGEIDFFDLFPDDADDIARAERNDDELAR